MSQIQCPNCGKCFARFNRALTGLIAKFGVVMVGGAFLIIGVLRTFGVPPTSSANYPTVIMIFLGSLLFYAAFLMKRVSQAVSIHKCPSCGYLWKRD